MGRYLLFLFLILPVGCLSLNERPWYGRWLEYEMLTSCRFQSFDALDTGNKSITYTSNDTFFNVGLGFVPFPKLKSEVEIEFANTRHMSFNFANAKIRTQYQWLNDIEGDSLSVVTAFMSYFPTTQALHDVAQFYHGNSNFKVDLILGKEFSGGWLWDWRIWGLGSMGLANKGSPWANIKMYWEKNFNDSQQLGVFSQYQLGFGQRDLETPLFFPGYGSIKYRILELGGSYHYQFLSYGTIELTYNFRLYAHNAPQYLNIFGFSYLFPFSVY